MTKNYQKALAEVEQIINQLEKEEYQKLPDNFIKLIKAKKDKKYKSRISFDIPLAEQNLLDETKAVIAVIYRLYLCS